MGRTCHILKDIRKTQWIVSFFTVNCNSIFLGQFNFLFGWFAGFSIFYHYLYCKLKFLALGKDKKRLMGEEAPR